jgi:hypothetical protein
MGFKSTVRLALASFCVSLFAACSGGSIGSNVDPGDGGGNGGGGGGGGGGGVVGAPAVITLVPQQAEIIADGVATVLLVATLQDAGGRAIAGEAITFETNAGELRNISNSASAAESTTGGNGQAALLLRSGTVATRATLVARHPSGLAASAVVNFTAGSLARLEGPVLSPTTVAPGGITTVVVRAFDANSNPVSGEVVTFDAPQNQSGGAFSAVTSITDANGLVSVTYQAGTQAGTDSLRARAGGATAPNTLRTTNLAVVAGAAQIAEVNFETGSASIVANGVATMVLRAEVLDQNGSPIPGISVAFSTTAGSISAGSAITNESGIAQVQLTSGTVAQQVTVATSVGGFNRTTLVQFVPGVPTTVSLVAAPSLIAPGSQSSLISVIRDANSNPVPGITVQFSNANVQRGLVSPTSVTTNAVGEARAIYQATNQVGTDTVSVRLPSFGAVAAGTVGITIDSGQSEVGTLALQTGANSIVANGSSSVALRATVSDRDGNPLQGLTVSFDATAGGLSAPTATTNLNGVAEVRLTSSTVAQQVTVRAAVAGFTQSAVVGFTAGAPVNVAVTAAPSTIAPSTQSSLIAVIRDANNNPVSGVAVQFANVNAQRGSVSPTSVTTNAVGEARAIYQATSQIGTDTVSARLPSFGAVTAGTVGITIDAAAATVVDLQVIAGSEEVAPGGTVLIRATVTSSSGNVAGKEVSFSSSSTGTTLSSPTAITNERGEADVILTAPNDPGIVSVLASIAGFNASVNVAVGPGIPALLDLFVLDAPSLPYNTSTTVRATVLDVNRNPVPGVQVLIDVPVNGSRGVIGLASGNTDANGRFTTNYTTGPGGSAVVTDRISVRVANAAVMAATVDLAVTPRLGTVSLQALSEPLTANGSSETLVRATVLDADGNPVRNAVVTFNTTAGTLTPAAPAQLTTNPQGQAEVTLTAPVTAGEALVIVDVTGGLSARTVVDFAAAGPATLNAFAFPNSIGVGGTATLVARIRDANGNPVTGTDVQFRLPSGSRATISAVSATTNADGEATTTYFSRDAIGTEVIQVVSASGALADSLLITTSGETLIVGDVTLALGTASVPAGGSAVAVRAQVLSTTGVAIQGATVQFATTAGVLDAAAAVTDSNGIAQVLLMPPTALGSIELSATTAGFRAEATLQVLAGPADALNSIIAAQPSAILADGTSLSSITVVLNDSLGNPLPDGTAVVLATDAGQLVTNQGVLTNGRASFELRSGNQTTLATVRVIGVSGLQTSVQFEAASTGEPASIRFAAIDPRISVVGVGQQDQTQIRVSVLDSAGNPIDESLYGDVGLNNLRAQFVSRPQGGESIAGTNADGDIVTSGMVGFIDLRTRGGLATVTLRSGVRSGVVEVRFSVLDANGTDFLVGSDVAAVAALPQVSIAGGPPHTIVFTQPVTNAIENLGNGNYRRVGKVDVTDRYGNSVPDGTVVNLQLMDSVILHDSTGVTLAGTDTLNRSGDSLIRRRCTMEPLANGEAGGCGNRGDLLGASSFSTQITRNDVPRFIDEGDLILIRNTPAADKLRVVDTVDNATQLTAHQPYRFDLTNGEFWVGAALSGGQIAGLSLPNPDNGNRTLLNGTGVVVDGIAEFRVTYPANVGSILSGCYGYPYADRSYDDRDRRSSVPQSRQVIVAASAGDNVTGIDVGNYCFAAIAGGSITPQVEEIVIGRGSFVDIGLTVRDNGDLPPLGGDRIRLPYVPVACFLSDFDTNDDDTNPATVFELDVMVLPNNDGFEETNVNGVAVVRLSNVGDDSGSATVTCTNGDATTTIEVTGR